MTSLSLKPSYRELKLAEEALTSMKEATDAEAFEGHWQHFLDHIERVWIKAERSCQPIRNRFEPWQGKYKRLRKTDTLLCYLKHARSANQHSIQDIIERKSASMAGRFKDPSGGHIKEMVIENGRIVHYDGDPMIIEVTPSRIELVSFIDLGTLYYPPISHLNMPITTKCPMALAELGLSFYQGYIKAVETKFFTK